MKPLNFYKRSNCISLLVLVLISPFVFSNTIMADYMASSTYKIQSDTLNFGGLDSSSTGFKLGDTLGEIGTGESNSTTYFMNAGFWQMQESFISISSPSDLLMTNMGGISGGSSEGSVSWLVTTDNGAGYTVTINSSTSPSLKSATDSFADYVPQGVNPDYNFTNGASNSSFGFSPEGTEVSTRFKDNGVICNTGTSETSGKCWDGLSTIPKEIAGSTISNMPTGANVSVKFRAEAGANKIQTSGTYNATITITAITL